MKKRVLSLLLAILMLLSIPLAVFAESQFGTGDINRSGAIDMMDYILLKRNYFGTFDLDSEQLTLGDINKSGAIDMMDYILLKRIYFGTYKIGDTIPVIPETLVVDALNYEKDVIPADFAEGWGFEDYKHKVILPKLNIDSVNAGKFNEKIYNENSYGYEELKKNQEGIRMYNIDYEFAVRDNLLCIIVWETVDRQGAGGNTNYKAYYYDSTNDCEITFTEYLNALDFDIATLTAAFVASPEFAEVEGMMNGSVHIIDALIRDETAHAIYDGVSSMDGWWHSEFTLIKVDNSSTDNTALTVGSVLVYEEPVDASNCGVCSLDNLTCHIEIPEIQGKSTYAINALNKKIYSAYVDVYDKLIYDQTNRYFDINYTYVIQNDILTVLINYTEAWHSGGVFLEYASVYYDIKNDVELTYDEYLASYDLTNSNMEQCYYYSETNQGYIEEYGDGIWGDVVKAVISEDEIQLIVKNYPGAAGYILVTVENNIT